jgi:transposase InsO family protein
MATTEVLKVMFAILICRHGWPTEIITDRGTQFTSNEFKTFCKHFKVRSKESTAYHHQTVGKVERFVRFLKTELAMSVKADQSDWDERLPQCLFTYRVSLNRLLQDSPFFLLYGRDPRLPQDLFASLKATARKIATEDVNVYKQLRLQQMQEAYALLNKIRRRE